MSGCEWVIEARGCDAGKLAERAALQSLFEEIVAGMKLHPVGETKWHQFPVTGGITGLALLEESHLACHTFPEYGAVCLNVFCCKMRPEWDFEGALRALLGAREVVVRRLERHYGA